MADAVDRRDFRARAARATLDLGPDDRAVVIDVVDEWLADHPDAVLPDVVELVRDIREELDLPPESEPAAPRWSRRRALAAVSVVVLVVAGTVASRWWATYDAAPQVFETGWVSDDLESVAVEGLLERDTVFRCVDGGTLELAVGLAPGGSRDAELESVTVPLLDGSGIATRTRTDVLRDPTGSLDDVVPFTGMRLDDDRDAARLQLAWELVDCPRMAGITTAPAIDVTYRALGRTRHATVELLTPLHLTTLPLDQIEPT